MRTRLNMSRSASRGLAVVGAGAFAVSLSVGGAGSAVAHPLRQIDSMSDLKGTWLTSLTGFQEGQPVSWQHRLTVRKVKGSAAVAWEEWLDCGVQPADCKAAKAGKQTGVNWSKPTRVLMVMGPNGVVDGVGTYGTLMLTPGDDGMTAVMLSNGQHDDWTATPDPTTGPSAISQKISLMNTWSESYAVSSTEMFGYCGGGAVDAATKNVT